MDRGRQKSHNIVSENQPPTADAAASLRSLVEVELWPDERLIWVGQPVPRIYAFGKGDLIRKAGLLSGITLLLFLYFALCGTPEVWYAKADFLLVAGLGTFGLVLGLGFLWFYQDAKHIVYAITNKRTLIFFLVSPVQLDTGRFHPWKVRERRNGAGDLMFPGGITFYAVPDVVQVTALLGDLPGR
jgi:hypothetical protein